MFYYHLKNITSKPAAPLLALRNSAGVLFL